MIVFLVSAIGGCAHQNSQPSDSRGLTQSQDTSFANSISDRPDPEQTNHAIESNAVANATKINRSKAFDWYSKEMDEYSESENPTKYNTESNNGIGQSSSEKEGQLTLDEALEFCDLAQTYWQNGELDNALVALDNAYSLILEIDFDQQSELVQQKEDLRFLISKRILEIYASRNTVANGDHDEIPLELNAEVQAEIDRFTSGKEKDFFNAAYQRSGFYRPYIVDSLKKAGLPEELSWLPLIESGYKVKALSTSRALGLWQFIPSTGYKFGLKRDRYVDERMDFIKSTDAAIAYLKELHNIFGDWSTVLAAYNCGENRVLQVIRTQNINYLDNFWDLYKRLPQETARYVPRFFATLHIIKNAQRYGIKHLPFESGLEYDTLEVSREIHLKDISAATNLDLTELKILNPELRYGILPPEPYEFRVPKNMVSEQLSAQLASIPTASLPVETRVKPARRQPAASATVYHVVRRNETVASIGRRYRVSPERIIKANNLRKANIIQPGRKLKIPQPGIAAAQPKPVPKESAATPTFSTHKVRRGDSLFNIAQRYGTTVNKIRSLNRLPSSNLTIGQNLKVPGSIETKQSAKMVASKTYKVKNGDTLLAIARKHKIEFDRFLRINKLTARSKIVPGQKLTIQ
jgi:membrane-bound lytic murein transglycosylase D